MTDESSVQTVRAVDASIETLGLMSFCLRFADFGTMLEIRDIQYFPDGRAVVDTVGERRFRVLQRGVCDGYHTAKVEFVTDDPVPCDNIQGEETPTQLSH